MHREFKKGIVTVSHQIDNINKDKENIKVNQ